MEWYHAPLSIVVFLCVYLILEAVEYAFKRGDEND